MIITYYLNIWVLLGTTSQETKIVKKEKITWKHNMVALLLISHAGLQVFLPYSHFITVVSIKNHDGFSSFSSYLQICQEY